MKQYHNSRFQFQVLGGVCVFLSVSWVFQVCYYYYFFLSSLVVIFCAFCLFLWSFFLFKPSTSQSNTIFNHHFKLWTKICTLTHRRREINWMDGQMVAVKKCLISVPFCLGVFTNIWIECSLLCNTAGKFLCFLFTINCVYFLACYRASVFSLKLV